MTPSAGAIEAALYAAKYWTGQDLDTAVAISGAESGWSMAAEGDYPAELLAAGKIDQQTYQTLLQYTCPVGDPNQPTVFGAWQVSVSDIGILPYADPCQNRTWLLASWANNVRAAYLLWRSANGFYDWTTYTDGRYALYLPEARAAVQVVLAGGGGGGGGSIWPVVAIGAGLAGVAAGWWYAHTPAGRDRLLRVERWAGGFLPSRQPRVR